MHVSAICVVTVLTAAACHGWGRSAAPAEAAGAAAGPEQAEEEAMVMVHPTKTDAVLINPGTGWQWLAHRPPAGEMEKMPLVGTIYYRTMWTEFEPEHGRYEGSPAVRVIDAWLAEAERHGRYVAIRVVPWNSRNPGYQRRSAQKVNGCDSAVPAYVFEDGAKGFPEPGNSGGWVPVFWDPVYLKHHRRLALFLGKRYGGHPNLAYVDVPGGNYGEMNLTNTEIRELDDLSTWRESGLTAESWGGMVRELCDMYQEAFPSDLLVAARDYVYYDGGRDALDYAVDKDVGLRDDGLGMRYCGPGRTNPEYEQHWPEVLCLYENGAGSWLDWRGERRVRDILEWAIDRTHASIVMVGKGPGGVRAYSRFNSLVREYGLRLGYRLVVEEGRWPQSVGAGEELPVSLAWRNLGNAPPYVDFAVELSLLTPEGERMCRRVVEPPQVHTKEWLPGKQWPLEASLPLPKDASPGQYRVAASIFEARAEREKDGTPRVRRRIRLGIQGEDAQTRYRLGDVTVE